MELGGRRLGQHGQDQFDVGHVIAQIFPFQPLDLPVILHLQIKRPLHDLVGQYRIFQAGPGASILSFVGQILPDGNPPHPLVDPIFRIALFLVDGLHPFHGEFRVFDLVDPLLANLGQPAFQGLYLG